jgi:3-methyl-2-oxobutanoate hydroxymethyltransferase
MAFFSEEAYSWAREHFVDEQTKSEACSCGESWRRFCEKPRLKVKTTTKSIRQAKGRKPLVCLTAYDVITARIVDRGGADLILVGDSVGNTVLGFDTTVPVSLEMMIHHTMAVARAKPNALLVSDLPFGMAHGDFQSILTACIQLMRAGAEAVKLEGGVNLAPVVAKLVEAGIPVCGHIGLQPQQVYQLGGYKKFGAKGGEADAVLADAKAIEAAGAFAIVGEMITPDVAKNVSSAMTVPLIGIGSGPDCDGQILVIHDLLGLTENPPGFAKPYANLLETAIGAVGTWAEDVRSKK